MPEKGSALSRPAREPSQQTESGLILPDSAQSLVSYGPQLKHQALVHICMKRTYYMLMHLKYTCKAKPE